MALMRLSFPNGDHTDVLVGGGSVRIGGGSDNDVVVADLRDRHALLTRDARGIVLEVVDANARAHVNARPVREKAFVRYGDVLCLDAVTIAISEPDEDTLPAQDSESARRPGAHRGVLRGMSGSWFGKSIVIGDGLAIGLDGAGALRFGASASGGGLARIEPRDGMLTLFSDEPDGSLVNGRRHRAVVLRGGDQLVFGRERFLVEACEAIRPRIAAPAEPVPVEPDPEADEARASTAGTAIWWLIAAAAVMGLVLAGFLARGT